MKKTKAEAEISKMRILLAAEDEFRQSGYVAANMDNVARVAGMAKSAIFWHYKNKANLFRAVVKHAIDRLKQISQELFDASEPALVMEKCREIVKRLKKDKAFEIIMIMSDADNAGEMPKEVLHEFYHDIAQFTEASIKNLQDCSGRGEIRENTNIMAIFLALEVVITGVGKIKELKTTLLPHSQSIDDDMVIDIIFDGLLSFQKKTD